MGGAVSRVGKRTLPVAGAARSPKLTEPARDVRATNIDLSQAVQPGTVAAVETPEGALLGGDEVKDPHVAAMLDQLQGAIKTRSVTISDPAVRGRKKTKQEREAQLEGRVRLSDLRALLHEHRKAVQNGAPDIAHLATKFGADEAVLRKVLAFNRAPESA